MSDNFRVQICATVILALSGSAAFFSAGCSRHASMIRHLDRAAVYYSAGKYDSAEIEYRNVLQIDSFNPLAINRLGLIYASEGRTRSALPFLIRSRELEPRNIDVRIRLSTIFLDSGRIEEARNEVLSVIRQDENNLDAPLLLLETATTPETMEDAKVFLLNRSNSNPRDASAQVALGALDLRMGNPKEAESKFRRALVMDSQSSSAYSALGSLLWNENDLPGAELALASAARLATARSRIRLQYAQFKIRIGDPDAATRYLEAMVEETPDYLPARLLLAEIAANQKKFVEATSFVTNVLSRDPYNPEALLLYGRILLAQGEHEKAVEELENMQRLYPKFAQTDFELGQAYFAGNHVEKAIASLNRAIVLKSDFPEADLVLAEAYIRIGDFRSAREVTKQVAEKHPEIPEALLLLMTADRGLGNLDDALDVSRKLGKAFPGNPENFVFAGLILVQQHKRDEARNSFTHALEIAPNFLPAVEQLINLDLSEKRYGAAIQRAKSQVLINPKLAAPQLLLANIFMAQGDKNSAESALLTAIRIQPDIQAAHLLLARLYATTNRQQMALANLQEIVAKNPEDTGALMMIGTIYDQQKNYVSARDAYETLLAKSPNFSAALNNLAYLYSEGFNQQDKAFELAQRASALSPSDPRTADTLGWILYKKHQYSWAVSVLQESATRLPTEAEAQFHLGMARYMMGEEEPARAALEDSLRIDASFSEADEARECLAILKTAGKEASAGVPELIAKALISRPKDPIVLARQASVFERDGDIDNAISGYRIALQESPAYVDAAIKLSAIYAGHAKVKDSIETLEASRKLNPSNPKIAHALGQLAFQTGDYRWANSLLQEASRAQPEDSRLRYDLALSLYSIGRTEEAVPEMQQAMQEGLLPSQMVEGKRFLEFVDRPDPLSNPILDNGKIEATLRSEPTYVPALMALAGQQAAKHDSAGSAKTYETILDQYPDFAPAMKNLVILDSNVPIDDRKASEVAAKAADAFPNDPELEKASGIIAFRLKDFAKAANFLQMGERRFGDDADLIYFLGMAQCKSNRDTEGRENLRRALKLNLRADFAAEAKRALDSN